MAASATDPATASPPTNETALLESVQKKNYGEVKRLLTEKDLKINCVDDHGMTPLQHAAYKGDKEMCKLLLDRGASVNHNEHEHGYTALMFAALSGNANTTSMLLEAGAKTTSVNSVGRTASQMAAFVGNHACVSVINTFIPKELVEYYTVPRGLETEPKLPINLSGIVHRFITRFNINPVGVALFVQQNSVLLQEAPKVINVLDLMSEKEIKSANTNEILSLKLHILMCIVRACHRALQKDNVSEKQKKAGDPLEDLMKFWLKGRSSDGFPENMEKFLRQCIREFRFTDSTILLQLVRNLAQVAIGDEPSALTLLGTTINSQKAVAVDDNCATCGEMQALKKCSVCKSVQYCDQRCQKLHWFVHKKFCPHLAKEFAASQAEEKETDNSNQSEKVQQEE